MQEEESEGRGHFLKHAVSSLLIVPQCDEKRPLCGNCQRRWGDGESCEFEDVDSLPGSAKTASASPPVRDPPIKTDAEMIGPKIDVATVKSSAADLQALRGAFPPASPLMRTIEGHRIDPFGTHPQGNANDVDTLMKHCKPHPPTLHSTHNLHQHP